MKKKPKKKPVRHRVVADYAVLVDGVWCWVPQVFEKYSNEQIIRLENRFGAHIGLNIITDLYKRVAALEKKK
jgi:hypothetical protein